MIKMIGVLVLTLCAIHSSFAVPDVPAIHYYWRDNNGTIPADALEAGTKDSKAFVGRTVIGINSPDYNGFFPGTLKDGQVNINVAAGNNIVSNTDKNVQILCTDSPSKFKWIPITKDDLYEIILTNKPGFPIQAGYETHDQIGFNNVKRVMLYIGRVAEGGEYYVGKIRTNSREYQDSGVLYYMRHLDSIIVQSAEKYELLVYQP